MKTVFATNHLNLSIQHLRENLLFPQEFVLLAKRKVRDDEAKALVLPLIADHSLERFALSLGKLELESCVLELLGEPMLQRKRQLLRIMEIRMSPRLTRLIWALVQYDYELPVMREVAVLAAASPSNAEQLLEILFLEKQDLIPPVVETLCREGGDLNSFIVHYHLIAESPLVQAVAQQFFQQTDEKSFLINEEFFLVMIRTTSQENLKPCLIHYLEQSWRYFSCRKINRAILNRFGLPDESGSAIWEDLQPSLRVKYKQWIFIDVMEEHFGLDSKKNALFGKFYKDIQHIQFLADGKIMVLDFGQFGIINLQTMEDHAYLMEKSTLAMELEVLESEGEPRWLRRRLQIEARDVIIEEKSSDILILNIVGVGKLFVQELMEELIRKEEGLWPVKYDHAIARFRETVIRKKCQTSTSVLEDEGLV